MSHCNLSRHESVAQDDQPAILGSEFQKRLVCGAIGLPGQIINHDCQALVERQQAEDTRVQPEPTRVQIVIRVTSSSGGS